MCPFNKPRSAAGFTLIELVVVIVVLAAGLAGILMVFNQVAVRSADPMQRQQAIAIAEGYMEEILGMRCPGSNGADRGAREFALDYDGTNDLPPLDINGDTITALAGYRVVVQVSQALGGAGGCNVRVTATSPDGERSVLAGFLAGG